MYPSKLNGLTNEYKDFASAHHRSAMRQRVAQALIDIDVPFLSSFGLQTFGLELVTRDEQTEVYKFNEHAVIKVDRSCSIKVNSSPDELNEVRLRREKIGSDYETLFEFLGDIVVPQTTAISEHPAHKKELVIQRKQDFIKYEEDKWLFTKGTEEYPRVNKKWATDLARSWPVIGEQFRRLARKSREYDKATGGYLPDIIDNLVLKYDLSGVVLLSTTPLEPIPEYAFRKEQTQKALRTLGDIGHSALS